MRNEGIPESLSAVQDSPEPKSALALYEGKRDTDLVDEEIDERILNLLGLKDVFDIDYATYKTLLREKLAEGRITGKELPREEDELLVNEFRRIKSKVGRFRIKSQKQDLGEGVQKTSAIIKANKLLPSSSLIKSDEETSENISDVEKILTSILKTLTDQNKDTKKKFEKERIESEQKKRSLKELNLEKGLGITKSVINKITEPFRSLLDKIQRFIFFTLLGRAFKLFMDWSSNPQNKKKLEVIGRFLKDWWPTLLGAWFLFATPLGKFVRTIIGSIVKLTFRLAKYAIPTLKNFLKKKGKTPGLKTPKGKSPLSLLKSPLVLFPAAVAGAAVLANEITGQRKSASVQAENKARAQTGKGVGTQGTDVMIDKSPSPGGMGATTPYGMLQGVKDGGIIQKLALGGPIYNFNNFDQGILQSARDGSLIQPNGIFSGVVGKNDGQRVSGAGEDTQYFPVAGGGGAVLAPNELVLTEEQQAQIQKDTGIHPASYVAGIKPRKISGKITPMSTGGVVKFNQGGTVNKTNNINNIMSTGGVVKFNQGGIINSTNNTNTLMRSNGINNTTNNNNNVAVQMAQGGGLLGALGKFLPRTGTVMAPKSSGQKDIRGVRQTAAGYQHKFLGMPIGNVFYPRGNTGQYNQQENRRYYERTGRYFVPTDFGPGFLPGIHGLYTPQRSQMQRSSTGNPSLDTAIQNARDISNIPGAAGYRPLIEKTINTATKMQQRNDVLRQAMRSYGMSGANESMNIYSKPIKRNGGGMIPQGPFTPLPHPGYVRPQGSFIPKPMFRLPGPMPGTTLPFGWDPFKGLQGGGLRTIYKENTGIDIPGGTADKQLLPSVAVQPGEGHYVIPKDAMQRGAVPIIDYVVAKLDPNSNPKNKGKDLIGPPVSTKGSFTMLPPIIQDQVEKMNIPAPTSIVPEFSAHRRTEERVKNMKIYKLI